MLELSDVSVSIKQSSILQNVSLHVPNGSVVGLIGRNGAGKTTLMRTVMGFLPVDKGKVRFLDQSLTRLAAHLRAHQGIGYMPEDRKLVPTLTVEENILLSFWATKNDKLPERLPWVYDLIPEVTEFSSRKAMDLSGGQQKLVALARALFCGTKLLLLDEPFEGVAPALAQRLAEVIADLKGHGQSVLLSESDHVHSSELLDRLYVIERGAVKEKLKIED
jgi:branched-chain amino acid transport system ATP-binding protein